MGGHESSGEHGFVGREAELLTAVDFCRRSDAGLLLVTGEPGIGRTAFARELARRLDAVGHLTVLLRPSTSAVDDLQLLVDLRDALERSHPRGAPSPPLRPPPTGPELGDLASDVGLRRAVTVLVDDIHLLAPAGREALATALEIAADSRRPVRAVVALPTLVTGEDPAFDANVGRAEIVLEGMGELELAEVLRRYGTDPLDSTAIGYLHAHTGGNPLFALAVARRIQGSAGRLEAPLPDSLRRAAQASVERLSDGARRVLEIVALWVDPIPETLLLRVPGIEPEDVDELVDEGTIRETRDGLTAAHRVEAEAALAEVGSRARRRRRADLATAVAFAAAEDLGPLEALSLLQLAVRAGTHAPPSLVWDIGRRALPELEARSSWGRLAETRERVLDAGERHGAPVGELAALALAAGVARARSGEAEAAIARYRQASAQADAAGDHDTVLVAEAMWARAAAFLGGDTPAEALVDRLNGFLDRPVSAASRVEALSAIAEILGPTDPECALEHCGRLVSIAKTCGDPDTLRRAHTSAAITELSVGRLLAADRSFDLAEAATDEETTLIGRADISSRRIMVDLQLGRHRAAALRLPTEPGQRTAGAGWPDRLIEHTAAAAMALGRGDLAACERWVAHGLRALRRAPYYIGPHLIYPTAIVRALYAGQNDEAAAHLEAWREQASGSAPFGLLAAAYRDDQASVRRALDARPLAERLTPTASLLAGNRLAAMIELCDLLDLDDGPDALARALDDLESTGATHSFSCPASILLLRARLARRTADPTASVIAFDRAIEWADREHAELQRSLARLGRARTLLQADCDDLIGWSDFDRAVSELDRMGARGVTAMADRLVGDRGRHRLPPTMPAEVTVMLTDVVGSTALGEDYGDRAYVEQILEHHRVVRSCVDRHGGTLVADTGDGLYAYFEQSIDAAYCATKIHRRLGRLAPTEGGPIRVRIGLARGRPHVHDGRLYGTLLNLAARVCAAAEEGLTVAEALAAADLGPASDLRLVERHSVRAKGIREPIRLWSIADPA